MLEDATMAADEDKLPKILIIKPPPPNRILPPLSLPQSVRITSPSDGLPRRRQLRRRLRHVRHGKRTSHHRLHCPRPRPLCSVLGLLRRGISVANAADVSSSDCADFAVGLVIDVLRKFCGGDRFVKSVGWSVAGDVDFPLGRRLSGKNVGIVGLGRIGSGVAKRLHSFDCRILYNSRNEKPSVTYKFYSDVVEMAADSDLLVVCCSLSDQTRHMINTEVLTALGKNGIVINIARGAIIDEKELVRFLSEGRIAGAGLDVFEHEPAVPKELFSLDNVVLAHHQAGFTDECFRDLFELVKGNFDAFFSNKPLLSPVI